MDRYYLRSPKFIKTLHHGRSQNLFTVQGGGQGEAGGPSQL